MTSIFSIDPGTTHSGVVRLDDDGNILYHCADERNFDVRGMFCGGIVVIEACRLYMGVGVETEQMIRWAGRFEECAFQQGCEVRWIYPDQRRKWWSVKKDSEQRVAILDYYGGKTKAIGNKKAPGPLYGVKSHAMTALALAIMAREGK